MVQSISILIGFLAAGGIAFLVQRSPHRDWNFLKTGTTILLLTISVTAAQYERSLRSPFEDNVLVCDSGVYEYGSISILTQLEENCKMVRKAPPPGFGSLLFDWMKDTFLSALLDIPGDVLGAYVGISLAGGKRPKLIDLLTKD